MTMENMNIVTAEQQAPNTISATNSIFNVQALSQLTAFANLMADATIAVPDHLVGKPADCMAIVMQAMQWGMNPYAVAQKTFFVNGKLGYEAQLISAILTSSGAIRGRFHYEYGGNWENCIRSKDVTVKKMGSKGAYEKTERVRDWSDEDEDGLYIRAGAVNAKAVRADIESAKNTLGSALYTELKNKAVKRYHLVDAYNRVEAAINSLPQPGEPDAAERFEEAELVLASAKRHLGDELHDKFSITLADMKPEYVA